MTDDERWDFAAEGFLLAREGRSTRRRRATLVISSRRAFVVDSEGTTTNLPFEATSSVSVKHGRMRRKLIEVVCDIRDAVSSVHWIPRSSHDADAAAETLAENIANRWLELGLGRFSVEQIDALDGVAASVADRDRTRPTTWRFPTSARPIVQVEAGCP